MSETSNILSELGADILKKVVEGVRDFEKEHTAHFNLLQIKITFDKDGTFKSKIRSVIERDDDETTG